MNVQEVNVEALSRAVVTVAGEAAAKAVFALYTVIDQAMKDAYDLGVEVTEQRYEERLDEAFDNGYHEGAFKEGNEAYDEGYLDGVTDQKEMPRVADAMVANIVSDRAQHALNGTYDASLVTDSGDEDEGLRDEA